MKTTFDIETRRPCTTVIWLEVDEAGQSATLTQYEDSGYDTISGIIARGSPDEMLQEAKRRQATRDLIKLQPTASFYGL